jgi:hypothetical protein
MPNTIYAYPTLSGLPALAKQYNVSEGKCYAINNSLDLLSEMSEATKSISTQFDILSADILMVYPGRLTQGKKFEKVAAFAGAMKRKTERDVKVVFCDFPSSDINPLTYKGLIKVMGYNFGIGIQDIAFTSDMVIQWIPKRSCFRALYTIKPFCMSIIFRVIWAYHT